MVEIIEFIVFGFYRMCVIEKINVKYNVCFICVLLLNMRIEYFSMGEGGCMYWSF